jgi:hypothetical protein
MLDFTELDCKFSSKFSLSVQVRFFYQVPYVVYFLNIGMKLGVLGLVQVEREYLSNLGSGGN